MSKTKFLNNINFPTDLKQLNHSELKILKDELREEMINAVSETGGHLGAGLGVVELTVALHYIFDTPKDKIIWDVGHQSYPHKILTGRKDKIKTLRQGNGLSGFTKRSESEYDPFGAAHSSTSISAALGIATANKLSKKNKIIVCATSVHKVIKIKRIINKVDFIFLNKAELLKLTNSSNIILGVKKILKQNKKIKIITTNSKNNVIFGSNEFIKKIKPPSIKVVNENGAGDALAAMMLYLFSINEKMNYILKTSVACGSYYASGKSLKTKSDFLKIKNLSKRVIVQ